MGAQSNAAPVIIKRKKVVGGGGHHGGAWKVAIVTSFIGRRFAPRFTCRRVTAPVAF